MVRESPKLDPTEVAAAVRQLLAKETDRVEDPHFIPEDRAGWHPIQVPAPDAPGQPYYDSESWRWFELLDIGYVDEMILLTFLWNDPATPALRYSLLSHADGLPTAEAAAMSARTHLRRLLEPGWRDRVDKHWLSSTQVLISMPPHQPSGITALDDRHHRREQQVAKRRREIWHSGRDTSP